jgi:hypothetical protein
VIAGNHLVQECVGNGPEILGTGTKGGSGGK